MNSLPAEVPDAGTPIFNAAGYIDPVWHEFFFTLLRRTGGTGGSVPVTQVTGSAPLVSSGGTTPDISILPATPGSAGSLSGPDKAKLDSVGSGAAVVSVSATAPLSSSGGVTPDISISPATTLAAGSMSAFDKTKLDSVSSGAAVASVSGVAPIASSGGAAPAISITASTGAAAGSMSAADKAKLDLMTYVDATPWTPVLTFTTPGNLAVTYASQVGTYTRIGHLVFAQFSIRTSAFTWTTSSGSLLVTGLPVALSAAIPEAVGKISWVGITAAGLTEVSCNLRSATPSTIEFIASGSGVGRSVLTTGQVPSGGSIVLIGTLVYPA